MPNPIDWTSNFADDADEAMYQRWLDGIRADLEYEAREAEKLMELYDAAL